MVLERRTPVAFRPEITSASKNAELWWIRSTQEGFFTYEEFLKRQHYLSQKIFTCEITGHGGLTYEQALQSERREALGIDSQFPEPLKGPILRHIQFSTEPRIDHVVDNLITIFSKEFFPNENVIWTPSGGHREEARIREKTSFPEVRNPDGSLLRPAKARYFVELPKKGGDALLARTEELSRHRRHFNKQVLRSFLRNSVQPRESWVGAPWIVKAEIAKLHHIPADVPANLRHEAVIEEKKKNALAQRTTKDEEYLQGLADKGQLPGVDQGAILTPEQLSKFHAMLVEQRSRNEKEGKGPGRPSNGSRVPTLQTQLVKIPKPEPIRYPCDDLQIPIKKRNLASRPRLKFLTQETSYLSHIGLTIDPLPLTGDLLQIWHTLNVFASLFVLDSFTFEDFVQALAIWSRDQQCELFSEIHCALLKIIVDRNGELQAKYLVDSTSRHNEWDTYLMPDIDSESDSDLQHDKQVGQAGPLGLAEKARILSLFPTSETWTTRVGECRFANDGWQLLMIGFLTQVAIKSRETRRLCESLLAELLTQIGDHELDQNSVREAYAALKLQSRVKILQLAILHVSDTKGFRTFMEDCDREATETRKKKIMWQSSKKRLVREWQELDQQRKLLRPDASTASVEQNFPAEDNEDDSFSEDISDIDHVDEKDNDEESDSAEETTLRVPRNSGRLAANKRKRDEEEPEKDLHKKIRADFDENAHYERVLQDMETKAKDINKCEDQIKQYDNALRENACHRARKLGTDRYLNHYYWYERNGMPFGGDEDSSTAEYEYANGCVWVQGPDPLQAQHVVNLDSRSAEKYAKDMGITIKDRKDHDEGETQLRDANHWGYIDDPEDLDQLIAYLDERGKDEKALRKELKTWRVEIASRMIKRKARLASDAALLEENEEEPAIGVATRRKQEATRQEARYPCLAWYNSMALGDLGRIHSDGRRGKPGPKPKLARQKSSINRAAKDSMSRSGRRR